MPYTTNITLYATPFSADNFDVVNVNSDTEAFALFADFPKREYTAAMWQREHRRARLSGNINDIENYNYLIFTNNGKRNYAFISEYEYVSENVTDIVFDLDPWLNFAGQYIFHHSPIDRQHPQEDVIVNGNDYPEPISPARWHIARADYGEYSEDDDLVFVVTAAQYASYINRASSFYSALGSFAAGNPTPMDNFYSAVIAKSCNCNGIMQANTSIVDTAGAAAIIEAHAKVGRTSDIYGAYHIPRPVRRYVLQTFDIDGMQDFRGDIDLPIQYAGPVHWNKIKRLPQFNQVFACVCGNVREYDYNLFTESAIEDEEIYFRWAANQSQKGCIVLTPRYYAGADNAGEFSVSSPVWDSTLISGTAFNQKEMTNKVASSVKTGIKSLLKLDIVGALEAVTGGSEEVSEEALETAHQIGSSVGTIAAYNAYNPLISISHYTPAAADLVQINNFFSAYGYSWNASLMPIFRDTMPYFNYVKCVKAIITAPTVPNRYLSQVIGYFERGIRLWKTIGDYKNTQRIPLNYLPEVTP